MGERGLKDVVCVNVLITAEGKMRLEKRIVDMKRYLFQSSNETDKEEVISELTKIDSASNPDVLAKSFFIAGISKPS